MIFKHSKLIRRRGSGAQSLSKKSRAWLLRKLQRLSEILNISNKSFVTRRSHTCFCLFQIWRRSRFSWWGAALFTTTVRSQVTPQGHHRRNNHFPDALSTMRWSCSLGGWSDMRRQRVLARICRARISHWIGSNGGARGFRRSGGEVRDCKRLGGSPSAGAPRFISGKKL